MSNLKRFEREFRADVREGNFEQTEGGILLKKSALLKGVYIEGIKGQPDSFRTHQNLIPDEGINYILDIVFGAVAKPSAWYFAPFTGSATPAASWTAANFASNATENTSDTEGYEEATRQEIAFGTAASQLINNYDGKAELTIVCASTITFKGGAILTNSTRGGTSGKLGSAVKFSVDRVLNNTDVWQAGYQVSLSDS
jgi:hypothetical protein